MTTRQAQVAAAKLARKAAAVIEERGWCKGYLTNERGNVCLLGAINVACGRRPDRWEPWRMSEHALYAALELDLGHFLSDWNDAPRRRKREVLNALATAADKLQRGMA